MSLHYWAGIGKRKTGITGAYLSRFEIVSRLECEENRVFFDLMRRSVNERYWRLSPPIPGLFLIKRAICAAYAAGAVSLVTAQRMIDASRSWEA